MTKILLVLLLSLPLAAQAAMVNLLTTLGGDAEVPSNTSPGTGTAAMLLDTDTGSFTWNIVFSGLTAPLTALHFHNAPVGENGPVVLGLFNPGFFGIVNNQQIAADGLSGTFMGMATLGAGDIDEIFSDRWYINVHSSEFPGGELRGQVFTAVAAPVPLPAAALMFAPALGLLAFATRRRTQA